MPVYFLISILILLANVRMKAVKTEKSIQAMLSYYSLASFGFFLCAFGCLLWVRHCFVLLAICLCCFNRFIVVFVCGNFSFNLIEVTYEVSLMDSWYEPQVGSGFPSLWCVLYYLLHWDGFCWFLYCLLHNTIFSIWLYHDIPRRCLWRWN